MNLQMTQELNSILVQNLPRRARLFCLLDCCHSARALALPYSYLVKRGTTNVVGRSDYTKLSAKKRGRQDFIARTNTEAQEGGVRYHLVPDDNMGRAIHLSSCGVDQSSKDTRLEGKCPLALL